MARMRPLLFMVTALALIAGAASASAATTEQAAQQRRQLVRRGLAVQEAEMRLARNDHKGAAKAYARAATLASADRDRAELLLAQADALTNAGRLGRAFEAYKTLLERYALHIPHTHVVAQLRAIAERFLRGDDSLFGFSQRSRAIEVYEEIVRRSPAGSQAATDTLRLARLMVEAERPEEAAEALRDVQRRHPASDEAVIAQLELSHLLVIMSNDYAGGTHLRQADVILGDLLADHPEHARSEEARLLQNIVRERQASERYELARFYLRPAHRRMPAARRYMTETVAEYPGTTAAVLAQLLLDDTAAIADAPATAEPVQPALAPASSPRRAVPAPQIPVPPPPANPAEMTPENVPATKPAATLESEAAVRKWLLPIDDLKTDRGESGHE